MPTKAGKFAKLLIKRIFKNKFSENFNFPWKQFSFKNFVLKVRLKPAHNKDCCNFLWFIINCDSLEIWHRTATTMPPVKGRNFYSFLVSWQLIIKLVKFWGSAAACSTNDVVCLDYLPAEISKVDKRGLPFGVIKIFFCLVHKHWVRLKLEVVKGRRSRKRNESFQTGLNGISSHNRRWKRLSLHNRLFSIQAQGMETFQCNSAENTYMLSSTSSTRSCFKA